MAKIRNDTLVLKLAHAIAGGSTISKWSKKNDVNPRTARNWANTPDFRATVTDIRQRVTNRVIGKLTRHALSAVDAIAGIVKTGENGSVRLNAAKAVVGLLIEVSNHAEAGRQLAELKARIANLEGSTDAKRDH